MPFISIMMIMATVIISRHSGSRRDDDDDADVSETPCTCIREALVHRSNLDRVVATGYLGRRSFSFPQSFQVTSGIITRLPATSISHLTSHSYNSQLTQL